MKTTISLFAQIAQLIPKQRFKNFYFISTTFPPHFYLLQQYYNVLQLCYHLITTVSPSPFR